MRKSILFIFITGSLRLLAQTNIYHPFPDSNAVWNLHFNALCFSNGMSNEYYSIVFDGDTVINSKKYHKMNVPYVITNSTGTCGGWINPGYRGAIRQDIPNRLVLIVPPGSSTEQLLYDFKLQAGDTLKGYIAPTNGHDKVTRIDSVLVGSTYRKRWILSQCFEFELIEGIGWMKGLLVKSRGCIIDETEYDITCFSQNNQTLYPTSSAFCELITGIGSEDPSGDFEIFPNPSTGVFNIVTAQKLQYSIYDIFGRKVSQSIAEIQSGPLDLSRNSKGVYFFSGTSGDRVFTRKIILQ